MIFVLLALGVCIRESHLKYPIKRAHLFEENKHSENKFDLSFFLKCCASAI